MACGQVCQCTGSLQLRVLRLGLLQDGDVGVGVFPEGEEVLMLDAYGCGKFMRRFRSWKWGPSADCPPGGPLSNKWKVSGSYLIGLF